MNPKTVLENAHHIAVLGVNENADSYANKIVRSIRESHKTAYPVNPKYPELFGDKVYPSLDAIEEDLDLVVFVVNPKIGMHYLDAVKSKGVSTIWLQPGTISDELLDKAKELELETVDACVLVVSNYLDH